METLQRLHNRGSISTGYDIPFSCKFEQDNSESMTRTATQSQGGNRKTWTWSGWIKRTELGRHMYLFSAGGTGLQILSTDNIRFALYYNNTSYYLDLNAKLRDTSAWYHIVGQLDTTQSTAQDRVKVWINGERQTSFSNDSAHNIPQNVDVQHLNEATGSSTGWMKICDWYASGRFFSGYAADWHFTDGVANEPTKFGEYDSSSGIWKPKEYTGTYGTNGFYLDFADASDLGDDESGNGNDFSEGNLTSADQATDTPTNNFCTMNMLDRTNGNINNQDGATKVTTDGGSGWCTMMATMGVTKGKWYWEYFKTTSGGANIYFGIAASDDPYVPYSSAAQYYIGNVAEQTSIGFQVSNNSIANGNSSNVFALLSGEVLRVALDMDNGALYFGKSSSTWANSGDPTSGSSKTGASSLWSSFDDKIVLPGISVYQGGDAQANFGGYAPYTISSAASDADGYGTFEYAPPSGYYALCTKNLEEYG